MTLRYHRDIALSLEWAWEESAQLQIDLWDQRACKLTITASQSHARHTACSASEKGRKSFGVTWRVQATSYVQGGLWADAQGQTASTDSACAIAGGHDCATSAAHGSHWPGPEVVSHPCPLQTVDIGCMRFMMMEKW